MTAEPHHRGERAERDLAAFEAEFDALVRAHQARLCSFAYRLLRSRDAAKDAVQSGLLKVWQRKAAIHLADPLAYLYQAVRHECLMALRRERRWATGDVRDVTALPAPPAAGPEAADLQEAIAQAIDRLPERCRLIYTMSREQDLTYDEIARILGISVKTVETQMGRALRRLREGLDKYL